MQRREGGFVHTIHLSEGVDVRRRPGIEELVVTRLQLAGGYGQASKTVFRCCIQTTAYLVLDPRRSTA